MTKEGIIINEYALYSNIFLQFNLLGLRQLQQIIFTEKNFD
jgi:hypothetical protein